MLRKVERDQVAAELASLDAVAEFIGTDPISRLNMQARREALRSRLRELEGDEHEASVGLFFSGKPVVASHSVEAEFATSAILDFQELVSKLWETGRGNELPTRGPVDFSETSKLHITGVAHGSFGFILEEVVDTPSMFPTPLKSTVDRASEIIRTFASDDDQAFSALIDELDPRLLPTLRDFFKGMNRNEATFRLVAGASDLAFDRHAVETAHERAEASNIEEVEIFLDGELLGIIPIRRRFEFRSRAGQFIDGKVASTLSEEYLNRIEREQIAGKWWRAKLMRREVRRFNRRQESYRLIDLQEIPQP